MRPTSDRQSLASRDVESLEGLDLERLEMCLALLRHSVLLFRDLLVDALMNGKMSRVSRLTQNLENKKRRHRTCRPVLTQFTQFASPVHLIFLWRASKESLRRSQLLFARSPSDEAQAGTDLRRQ